MLPLRTQQLSVPQLPFGEVPLAYGLRREVKNLTLSAVTHVPALDRCTLSWSDTFAQMPLVMAGL